MGGWLSSIVDPPATQAWAQLTANICYCEPEPLLGACCDPFDGTCTDSVLAADCQPPLLFNEGTTCAELDPPCGNPGSCCDDFTGTCKILYAPSSDDNPRLRAEIAHLTASNVDYFDAQTDTPRLSELTEYDAVLTWWRVSRINAVFRGALSSEGARVW